MNVYISFTPPLSDKEANFRQLAATGIYESLARVGNDAAAVMMSALIDAAPKRTGNFSKQIRMNQSGSGGGLVYRFTAPNPLADWIIHGTKPHAIDPKSGGVLRFVVASGDVVFARHVNHPGTKANDFPAEAWRQAQSSVLSIFERMGRELATEVVK